MAEESNRGVQGLVVGFVLGLLIGGGAGFLVGKMGASAPPAEEPEPAAAQADPAPVVTPEPAAEPEEAEEAEAAAAPAPAPAPAAPATVKPREALKPSPAPAPAVTPPSKGPTQVVFEAKDGTRYPSDAVPAGSYTVLADWGEGLVKSGKATVSEGKPMKLVCDPKKKSCTAN